jgi:hypothetical protein
VDLLLVLLGLALLFERLTGLLGGGLAGRLVGHVGPLPCDDRTLLERRAHRRSALTTASERVRRCGSGESFDDLDDVLGSVALATPLVETSGSFTRQQAETLAACL